MNAGNARMESYPLPQSLQYLTNVIASLRCQAKPAYCTTDAVFAEKAPLAVVSSSLVCLHILCCSNTNVPLKKNHVYYITWIRKLG